MPPFTSAELYAYLIGSGEYTAENLKSFMSLLGYKLFSDGHVQDCTMHCVKDMSYTSLKFKVLPTERSKTDHNKLTYNGFLIMDDSGVVKDGFCPCREGASQSQNRVRTTIGKPFSLACSLPDIPPAANLTRLRWTRCSTEDQCRNDWYKFRIAYIRDVTKVYVDHPERYKLDSNGTLTIKEVLPEDDNKTFICLGHIDLYGKRENMTVLEINREQPKIITRNPFENEIIEGMPLMLEFKVHGYPYPSITLRHNGVIILKGTKMDSMYIRQNASAMYNGDYMLTAENLLGNDSITRKVKVVVTTPTPAPSATSSPPSGVTSPTPATNAKSSAPSGDHINTEGSHSCGLWKALSGVGFGLVGAVLLFINRNKVRRCLPNTSQDGSGSQTALELHSIEEHDAQSQSGDVIISGKSHEQSEGTNGFGQGDGEVIGVSGVQFSL